MNSLIIAVLVGYSVAFVYMHIHIIYLQSVQ